jgi:hypothetical protein
MFCDHLIALIVADGFGTKNTDLFKGEFPTSPDLCVAVTDYAGREPLEVFGETSPAIERPSAQVKVRGAANDYDTPRTRLEKIYLALAARGAFVVNGTRYMNIAPISTPFTLGRGDNGCWVFAVNFTAMRDKTARFVVPVEKVGTDAAAIVGTEQQELV